MARYTHNKQFTNCVLPFKHGFCELIKAIIRANKEAGYG